jgi:hypothetical protein
MLRLLLLALMGLALASRLALGATLPVAGTVDGASAPGSLAKLQAAIILCQIGQGHQRVPTKPQGPLLSDLLLFEQADNAHALAGHPVLPSPPALHWSAVSFRPAHAAARPPLWRPVRPARGPPPVV